MRAASWVIWPFAVVAACIAGWLSSYWALLLVATILIGLLLRQSFQKTRQAYSATQTRIGARFYARALLGGVFIIVAGLIVSTSSFSLGSVGHYMFDRAHERALTAS